MTDAFSYAVQEIFNEEGGFVNDPNDPGGATNMGITLHTLSQWRNKTCTVEDVQNLTPDEASKIYKALYWDKVHGDDLKPAVALVMFDAAVNQGVGMSIKLAQRALNVSDDGVIGPQTISALNKADPLLFLVNFSSERALYYIGLQTWRSYGRGWMNRLFHLAIDSSNFITDH